MTVVTKSTVLESLVETYDTPALIVNHVYQIVAVNQQYCDSYHLRKNDLLGKRCHEAAHHSPESCQIKGEDCPFNSVMENNSPAEVFHTHFDQNNLPDRVRIKGYPLMTANGDRFVVETIQRLTAISHATLQDLEVAGQSAAFLSCMETLRLAAPSNVPVLLYGETGVGKEMAARCIHQQSPRQSHPFVELNCAAIPESLFESEVFGHERGAFTSSVSARQGLFELADKGTLFLDEIGELPHSIQAKLLRVLDSGEFRRVGGSKTIRTDVRIITATNRNLLDMVDKGLFREDLYFRIAGFRLHLPPLRERKSDIPLLAQSLIQRICKRNQSSIPHLSRNATKLLTEYNYPGNIRELSNVLQRGIAVCNGDVISARHIHFDSGSIQTPEKLRSTQTTNHNPTIVTPMSSVGDAFNNSPQKEVFTLANAEAKHIEELLSKHNRNRRKVAELLGISERTMYRKLRRFGLS